MSPVGEKQRLNSIYLRPVQRTRRAEQRSAVCGNIGFTCFRRSDEYMGEKKEAPKFAIILCDQITEWKTEA